jgi:catechol 2,3-dioxygenase-like lactoylglutathione lyase family enzyme
MKYHHIGIPTQSPQEDETYLEAYDIYCTDHESNPYGIQWMRYGERCHLPKLVQELPHIAFEVDDLDAAIHGKDVIIQPNSPGEGVLVAFVVEKGAPVEFLQFTKT